MGSYSAPHLVCIPFPARGHVNPFMQLSKLLHSKGFHITFVNTEFNHNRLLRSKCQTPLKTLPDSDEKDVSNGYWETPSPWIPRMEHMRLKDMPTFVRSTDAGDVAFNRWMEEAEDNLKSDGIIINTFYEFENQSVDTISATSPELFCIGPLTTLCKTLEPDPARSSLWKENPDCLDWLDRQDPESVLYVNCGSIAVMTEANFQEFAWGLANSGHRFWWILRPDVVMGRAARFPEGFAEVIEERGLIVNWCPQEKVLGRQAVAAFLTHSGWNSTVEGICGGIRMLSWPFFAEQLVNCRYASTTWGVGMEVEAEMKREELAERVMEKMEGEEENEKRRQRVEEEIGDSAAAGCSAFPISIVWFSILRNSQRERIFRTKKIRTSNIR